MWKCQRHEKTCDGKVQLKYPGELTMFRKRSLKNLKTKELLSQKKHAIFRISPPSTSSATLIKKKRKN